MFGGKKHLEKELRKNGAQAPAEVREASKTHMTVSAGNPQVMANTDVVWKLVLEVRPEGEASFAAELRAPFPQGDIPGPGRVITVLYDPHDHSKVAVDHSDGARLEGFIASTVAGADDPAQGAVIGDLMRSVMPDTDAFRKDPRGVAKAMREQMRGQMAEGGLPAGLAGFGEPPASVSDPVDQLAKLADLRDRGVLDAAEFETQKKRLLGEAP